MLDTKSRESRRVGHSHYRPALWGFGKESEELGWVRGSFISRRLVDRYLHYCSRYLNTSRIRSESGRTGPVTSWLLAPWHFEELETRDLGNAWRSIKSCVLAEIEGVRNCCAPSHTHWDLALSARERCLLTNKGDDCAMENITRDRDECIAAVAGRRQM